MKIACFVRPHIGGTFSVFRQLREGLASEGLDLRWMTSWPSDVLQDDVWQGERGMGEVVDPTRAMSPRRRTEAFVRRISDRSFDAVMLNVLGDCVETDVARYLPSSILRVAVVHNITPGTYAAARSVRDHVHATVCVSPRCHDDLVRRHSFDPSRTICILNAVDVDRIAAATPRTIRPKGLRLLFLGRLEDISKGVLWLPRIVADIAQSTTLTIAGSGPDEAQLRSAFEARGEQVSFLGSLAPDRIPGLLARHDALLMPSRFEGAPMSLIEGMAAGCVPIASRIRGVTDAFVSHGRDGLLFPLGDCREAARLIRELECDKARLLALSEGARARALLGCRQDQMAGAYAGLFERISAAPPSLARPLTFDHWRATPGQRRPLRSYAPESLKNWIRLIQERLAIGL